MSIPLSKTVVTQFIVLLFASNGLASSFLQTHKCRVSTTDSEAELRTTMGDIPQGNLFFFIAENTNNKKIIIPMMTNDEMNLCWSLIPKAAMKKNWLPDQVTEHAPEALTSLYAAALYKRTALSFLKGALLAGVTEYSPSNIGYILQNGIETSQNPMATPLLRTTSQRGEELKIQVPFLKQDLTWGRTVITVSCFAKPI